MVINVASFGGRSHMLDLARELEKQGNVVRFYSYMPTKRAIQFGLKKECSYTLYYWALPFLVLFKVFGFRKNLLFFYRVIYDYITAWIMKPCDVFIGQVPMHLYSLKKAKKKFGAITICESGLSNIDVYIKILSSIGIADYPKIGVSRYKACYSEADYISVASDFSKQGFIRQGFSEEKLMLNPYGVALNNFHPTVLQNDAYDCLMVGQWSKRKGVDMAVEACRKLGCSLLHVGALVDMPFPSESNFEHIDPVNEHELIKYYSKAKIFLFPSYEDGFGLVLIQALACGLPIVCSPNTGGPTLKRMLNDKKWIVEMNDVSTTSLEKAIEKGLNLAKLQTGERFYAHDVLQKFSWEAYGNRYNTFLKSVLSNDKNQQ